MSHEFRRSPFSILFNEIYLSLKPVPRYLSFKSVLDAPYIKQIHNDPMSRIGFNDPVSRIGFDDLMSRIGFNDPMLRIGFGKIIKSASVKGLAKPKSSMRKPKAPGFCPRHGLLNKHMRINDNICHRTCFSTYAIEPVSRHGSLSPFLDIRSLKFVPRCLVIDVCSYGFV